MKYDYVIIGGGISGMTAALILAKEGYSTALVEKSTQLAPTVRGFTRKGLYFDTGFHYAGGFGEGEPLDILFRYLGLAAGIEKKPLREDGFDTFRCLEPDFVFSHPWGYDRIREQFHSAFPGEAGAIDTYFSAVRKQFYSIPYVNLDLPEDTLKPSVQSEVALQSFLDGLTNNDLLKCILSMHCFLHGTGPDEVSFDQHAWVAGSYYESASAVLGGGLSIVQAFEERLGALGVDLFTGAEASKVLTGSDGSLWGIELKDGRALQCGACICTIHPLSLLGIVPDNVFRRAYTARLRDLEETVSAAILYAACDGPIPELDGTNLFLFPRPDFKFLREDMPVEARPMYITAAGTGRKGTSEKQGFIAICPMSQKQTGPLMDCTSGNRSSQYEELKEEIAEAIMRSVKTTYPQIASKITNLTSATPLTLRDYTNSPYGSLYGVKHRVDQVNPMPVTRLKGLFLAGQAITAPGVMGAVMSSFVTCGSIIGHEKLRKELRACR